MVYPVSREKHLKAISIHRKAAAYLGVHIDRERRKHNDRQPTAGTQPDFHDAGCVQPPDQKTRRSGCGGSGQGAVFEKRHKKEPDCAVNFCRFFASGAQKVRFDAENRHFSIFAGKRYSYVKCTKPRFGVHTFFVRCAHASAHGVHTKCTRNGFLAKLT